MEDLQTYCLYGGASAFSLLLCWYSEKTGKRRGLFAAALILIIVAGFRSYSVGVDTSLYKTGVEYFYYNNEVLWSCNFSYGYGIFAKFLLSLNFNYTFLLIVQAAITNGLILARFWDFRGTCSLTFMLFIYICTAYFVTLCIMCQYIAVALVFWGSRFADKGRTASYLIAIMVAATLHISALIALIDVAMRLTRIKGISPIRALLRILALACVFVTGLYGIGLLLDRYATYSSNISSVGFMVFAQAAVLLISLLACDYFAKEQSTGTLSLKNDLRACAPYALRLYSLGLLLGAASYVIANAGRISYYFSIYGCVCFGAMAKYSSVSRSRFLCSIFLIVWHVAYCIYACFINPALGIVPYSFVCA